MSLLTDFEMLDAGEIRNKRDELQERTAEVYSNSPRTDAKSYQAAQKALKTEEEQTFSEEEIDIMLPNSIRRCNRKCWMIRMYSIKIFIEYRKKMWQHFGNRKSVSQNK